MTTTLTTTTPVKSRSLLTPETVGDRVYNPVDFLQYSAEAAKVVLLYGGDPDISLVIWNLEPGQENKTHAHADYAQTFIVLCGNGVLLRGDDGEPVAIKAGEIVINPRTKPHGILNTGTERLSYLAVSSRSPSHRV
jgi:mannose-6-phosphate isomerase-like protein (cupin superfamily)